MLPDLQVKVGSFVRRERHLKKLLSWRLGYCYAGLDLQPRHLSLVQGRLLLSRNLFRCLFLLRDGDTVTLRLKTLVFLVVE